MQESIQEWIAEHHILISFLAYTMLTLIFTYPAILHFTTTIIGPPEDNLQTYWNFWWVEKALFSDAKLYFTDYLFYPAGVDLGLHTLTLYNAFLAIPLSKIANDAFAYNFLMLHTFVLAGLGMYLLVFHLTKHKLASFFSGILFAFSPYHQAHALHHLNLSSIQFIPFYVLFLLKLFETKERKYAVYAALFLFLIALGDWQNMVYILFFSMIFLLFYLYQQQWKLEKILLKQGLMLLFLFTILVLPFVYPVARTSITAQRLTNLWGGDLFVADFLGFFTPDMRHSLSQANDFFLAKAYQQFRGNPWEATVFLGYVVIMLSIYALWKIKFPRKAFWFSTALIGMLLSLGPHLNVLGKSVFPYMPFRLLQIIPFINLARVPSRYIILTMLALSVVAGYAMKAMLERVKEVHAKKRPYAPLLLFLFLTVFVLFEYSTVPYVLTKLDIPEFYLGLKNNPEDFALLELPLLSWKGYNQFMFYQTVHEKKLLFGSISHFPKERLDYLKKPFFELLIFPEKITEKDLEIDTNILQEYKVKYIIVHPDRYKEQDKELGLLKTIPFLEKKFKRIYQDEEVIVYEVEHEGN